MTNHDSFEGRDNHAAIRPETTPLYTASVYTFPSLEDVRHYYEEKNSAFLYRRNGNPNTSALEALLSGLEGTEASVLASSGMAAIAQTCFAILRPGDTLLATEVLYGGTYAFFEQVLRPFGVTIEYLDVSNRVSLMAAYNDSTKMVYAETIANPLLQVTDLDCVQEFAREHQLYVVVDNTFATPTLIQPASSRSTIAVNSLTKYLNGHSDVIGGVCSGSAELVEKIRRFSETFGSVLAPFDAWMTERGLQTFELRVRQQFENAMQVALGLEEHKAVSRVYYPGLSSHPTHAVAKRLLRGGFGAIVSFELPGGEAAVDAFIRGCHLIQFAPSLGGVKTTTSHPALTSHRALTPAERARLGITDGIIRLSVGIEPFDTIWDDLLRGLAAAEAGLGNE